MISYQEFILVILYMVMTYNIIALKYSRSRGFSYLSRTSRAFLVALHVFIVITNIFLYLWLISKDFNTVQGVFRVSGMILFTAGIFLILWGIYSLKRAVFIPDENFIKTGPFALVRHPMYLGGIIGALGIAAFAGSLFGLLYTIILAAVLSHIADSEEKDLLIRFGSQYEKYKGKVPKIFPFELKNRNRHYF